MTVNTNRGEKRVKTFIKILITKQQPGGHNRAAAAAVANVEGTYARNN